MLKYEKVSISFNEKTIIDNFSFDFLENNIYVLMGESGCGKTTLLRAGCGLLRPSSGKIILEENNKKKLIKKTDSDIFMMNQGYVNFPWKTSIENILFPLKIRGLKTSDYLNQAENLLDEMGLSECINKFPVEMSGGQRQRLALARVLISKPKILMMDEPLSALDKETRIQIQDMILEFQRVTKCLIIIITHDIDEARKLASRDIIHLRKVKHEDI